MTRESFAIVGASLAGCRAAQALRTAGHDGPIRLIGAEKHLPYDRPPLSKGILDSTVDPQDLTLVSGADWADLHVDLVLGQSAVALRPRDRLVELADGTTVDADKVLLCTGGAARQLDVPGADLPGVFQLRTVEDSVAVREGLIADARVVVVGAGFIGCEVAATAQRLGCDVTMVEVSDVPLWRVLGVEMGRFYAQLHADEGVQLVTGTGVVEIRGSGAAHQVVLADGTLLDADLVVVGVGIEPSTALAEQVGAQVANGIIVDEYCETTVPGVFAAGDVANHPNALLGRRLRLEHWRNAQNQAASAAASMLGRREAFSEVPWFWSDQFGLNLQVAGHPGPADTIVWRGDPQDRRFSAFYLRHGLVSAVVGLDAPGDVRAGMDLIASFASPQPAVLSDPSTDLRALARAARKTQVAGSVSSQS